MKKRKKTFGGYVFYRIKGICRVIYEISYLSYRALPYLLLIGLGIWGFFGMTFGFMDLYCKWELGANYEEFRVISYGELFFLEKLEFKSNTYCSEIVVLWGYLTSILITIGVPWGIWHIHRDYRHWKKKRR